MAEEELSQIKWNTYKQNSVKIEHINSQSLLGHLDEVKLLVVERKLDILCVSETWLLPSMEDRFISIPDFNIFRQDLGRGGGVCIYVKKCLTAHKVAVNVDRVAEVEDLWITVQCRKLPSIIIGTVYRHPKALVASYDYISDIFKAISLRNKPVFIFGDMNDDMLIPNSRLDQVIRNLKLSQIVNKPTRISNNTATLLDLLITNKPEMLIQSDVLPCQVADHELVSATVNFKKPKRQPQYKTFRSLCNYSQEKLCNKILENTLTLNNILNTDNVDLQTETFTNVFIRSIDSCAPEETKLITRPPAPWINENIKIAIEEREQIHKLLKQNRSSVNLQEEYKNKKKSVKLNIHRAKATHFKERFKECGNNSAKKWSVVKELIPGKKTGSGLNNFDDVKSKVDEFNEFFANVGKKTYEKTQENLANCNRVIQDNTRVNLNNQVNFRPQPVSVETIILTFKQLRETKAVGTDGIAFRFVRDSLVVTSFYLTVIINTSIVTGVYPTLWKHAIVPPILKSGDINDVSNYRPISILPVLSKLLEKIVANQLREFLERNRLLSNTQHGFRTNLSTETALMKVTDKIYNNIDNNKITLLVLCDLSKAFDSINHSILIKKLNYHFIDAFWFDDYLLGRSQSVKIEKCISSKKEVTFGVPQGSILGPILFLIFVNDMSKLARNCFLIQYADDSQFIFTGSMDKIGELVHNAEETLKEAKTYFDVNGLKVNAQKTQIIFLGNRQNIAKIPNEIKVNFDGNLIEPSKVVKNLGVYMDCHMSFDKHIDEMHKKTMGTLIFLNHIKDKIDKETRVLIVQSLALGIINYCCKIWGSACKTQLHRVQKLQNFAAKIATGNGKKYDRATPHINLLKWLKIEQKYLFDICIMIYKTINKETPTWLLSFPTVGEVIQVATRQSNDLFVPRTRTDSGKRQLAIRGPTLWNNLPNVIKESNNLNLFKCKLKEYFLIHN